MNRLSIKEIATAGLIAAIYVVLSLAFLPVSFGVYQIRVAEALTVLPFLTRAAIPGLYAGCVLANIFGGMGWLDIVIGPIITLIAAFLTRASARMSNPSRNGLIATVPLILMWIGAFYLLTLFKFSLLTVVGGVMSIVAFVTMAHGVKVNEESDGNTQLAAIVKLISIIVALVSIYIMQVDNTNMRFVIVGGFLLIAALFTFVMLIEVRARKENHNILIAPLPPVILNAFGVSLYLAPLLGFNYWFSVQMVGVGELIACYLLGLPLLILLRKRRIFD